ncbi:hypothetical protein [Methanoculleus sp.]|uniref:hypothetical protein n=1 Tax=Methanoculleus sp. TaxID=90427 RepID=UPI0026004531|nr:hypothetical protein [Methanoculleus sp.]MCK9319359.1 hypothetical protein [Methanoculleus sp.]
MDNKSSFDTRYQKLVEQKPIDKVENIYNQSVEVGKQVGEKTITWFSKYASQVFMVFMSLLLVGIQQFAEPQFDPYFFLRPKFWYDYIPFVTAQWLILFAVITGNNKWLAEVDVNFLRITKSIQEHVDKDKKTPYIFEGAKVMDRERKIRAFRNKISREIDNIIKKYKFGTFANMYAFLVEKEIKSKVKKTKVVGQDEEGKDIVEEYEEIIWHEVAKVRPKLRGMKLQKEYELKQQINALLTKLTDEFISENIDHLKVKYSQVTESGLVNGFKPSANKEYESDFQEHTTTAILNEFGIGQLVTMAIGFVMLSLDLIVKGVGINTWIFFVFKMFMLVWVYFKANFRSKFIFQKTNLKAVQERDSMLDRIERMIIKKENNKEEVK